jgi:hypothetical protein
MSWVNSMAATFAMLSAGAAAAQDGRWRDDGWRGRASVRTFEAPRFAGLPLDICPRDVGIEGLLRGRCGIPVANEYCRSRGFADAVDAPHTAARGPTRLLNGQVVDHPWTTTFRYITCER